MKSRRLISILLLICMVVNLLPSIAIVSSAEVSEKQQYVAGATDADAVQAATAHTYDAKKTDCDADCNVCGTVRVVTHSYDTAKYNEFKHLNECLYGAKANEQNHTLSEAIDGVRYCECGYSVNVPAEEEPDVSVPDDDTTSEDKPDEDEEITPDDEVNNDTTNEGPEQSFFEKIFSKIAEFINSIIAWFKSLLG